MDSADQNFLVLKYFAKQLWGFERTTNAAETPLLEQALAELPSKNARYKVLRLTQTRRQF